MIIISRLAKKRNKNVNFKNRQYFSFRFVLHILRGEPEPPSFLCPFHSSILYPTPFIEFFSTFLHLFFSVLENGINEGRPAGKPRHFSLVAAATDERPLNPDLSPF